MSHKNQENHNHQEHQPAQDDSMSIEERLNDAQILYDEADDVALPDHYSTNKLGLYIISPSSAIEEPAKLDLAVSQLDKYGFEAVVDKAALHRDTRFAGTDKERIKSFERALKQKSDIVMASRGGYGISRILHKLNWKLFEKHPKTFVGYSDFTAFNLALLAKTGQVSYTGPAAVADFGQEKLDDLTAEVFAESMRGELEILSFESRESDAVDVRGVLWGGNLAMITSLLGTPFFPKIKKGILFIEDVGEHPFRVERMLTQLLHAGVLQQQKAIVLGHFTNYRLAPNDRGYDMPLVVDWLRSVVKVPIVQGLPYGHGKVRLTLPIGKKVGLAVENHMAYLLLDEHDHSHDHDHDHSH